MKKVISLNVMLLMMIFLHFGQAEIHCQAIPDSCWKLIWKHDPHNGYHNYDSVIYDYCRYGDLIIEYYNKHLPLPEEVSQGFYAKKWFVVIFPTGALNVPECPRDSLIIRHWWDIDSAFYNIRQTFEELEDEFGAFQMKKITPDIIDSNSLASRTWKLKFNNYVKIDSVEMFVASRVNLEVFYYHHDYGIDIQSQVICYNNLNYFNIIPQPANEYIEIIIDNEVTIMNHVPTEFCEIYNVLGECVKKNLTPTLLHTPAPLERGMREGVIRLDISALPVGLYFVRIGEFVGRFVKM